PIMWSQTVHPTVTRPVVHPARYHADGNSDDNWRPDSQQQCGGDGNPDTTADIDADTSPRGRGQGRE
ncbi:MAG: hypothetical protein WBL53_02055, partial [Pseudonocardiaceae bacterium]